MLKSLAPSFVGLILLLCAASIPAFCETLEGKVIGISDGDTITVLVNGAQPVKVRLYGIDCPESRQDFGTRAKQFASSWAYGKQVKIQVAGTDLYGQTIGLVSGADGKSLNQDLLSAGLAWVYPKYCTLPVCKDWYMLEASARASRRGLWADAAPVPLWNFRKKKPRWN